MLRPKHKKFIDPALALTLSNLKNVSRRSFVREVKRIHKEHGASGVAKFLEVEEKELDFVLKKQLGILDIMNIPGMATGGTATLPTRVASVSLFGLIRYAAELLTSLFQRRVVTPPPGTQLDRLAEFLSSTKTYHLCLRPTIADMQNEYYDALAAGRPMKARWTRISGYWAFWKTWGVFLLVNTIKIVSKFIVG